MALKKELIKMLKVTIADFIKQSVAYVVSKTLII